MPRKRTPRDTLSTSQIARAVGLHPNTIRVYESWGMLSPVPRDPRNGYRRYYYAIPWEEHYIWGATAGMLKGLSDRVAALDGPTRRRASGDALGAGVRSPGRPEG